MLSLLLLAPVSLVAAQGPYPIPSAGVSISGVSPEGSALTDGSGNFLVSGLGTGSFTGTISARGYMDKSISGTITQGGTANLGDIFLLPSAVIKGTVLTHTGGPSAGSMVVLLDASNGTVSSTMTGTDGAFTLDTDIATGTYWIYATPPGSLFTLTGTDACSAKSSVTATQGSTTSGKTINLLQSGTISGQVTDDHDNGIAGVSVWATTNSDERYFNVGVTDSTGHYTMTANLVAGSYNVTIPMFSSAPGYVINYTDVKLVTLTTGGSGTANFKLHESGSIAGRVTTYDGSPAAGVSVSAFGTAGIGVTTTTANGSYLINSNLGTGQYTVYAASDVFNTETVNVTIGELTSPVDMQLSYNLAYITGKVSDSVGPLQYAGVEGFYDIPNPWLPGTNSTTSDSDSTDSSGDYRLEIEVAGNWTSIPVALTATADGYSLSQKNATAIKGQTTSNVNFVLTAGPRGSVSGRVVSNSAPPLLTADLTISASAATIPVGQTMTLSGTIAPTQTGTVTIYESINGSGWFVHSTRTLSAGAYSISFSFSDNPSNIGIHSFYATWPGNSEYGAATSGTVTVNVTQPLQNATLAIQASDTSVTTAEDITFTGTLSAAKSGTVTLRWSINGSGFTYTRSVTMTNGQFSTVFGASTPGTWAFKATWAGDAGYNPAESNTVSVSVSNPPPQTASFTFALAGTMDYTGNVLTVDGTGYPASQLPKTFTWDVGSVHTFAWASPVSSASTTYTWASASGQSTAQSGSVTSAAGGGTVTATYTGAPVKSGCFIATATYGSASAPQVQALRDFRDGIAMKTFAGSSFMYGFLTWYYSWSPPVADAIAPDSTAKGAMQIVLQPLLGILQVATATFSALSFSGEFAIVASGFVSAALIGLVYFVPLTTLSLVGARRLRPSLALPRVSKALLYTAIPWAASVALIAVAEIAMAPALMVATTMAFVALTVLMAVSTVSIWLANLFKRG